MQIGTTVRLHSLVARPTLNGCRGKVVKAFDSSTGRCSVHVDGETQFLALRLENLTDLTDEAIQFVFTDEDLLRLVLLNLPRWIRAGIVSGISSSIRKSVQTHPDLYRSIVVLAAVESIPRGIAPLRSARGFHRANKYGARHCVEEGALPLLPHQVASIENKVWIETLLVEPGGDEPVVHAQIASVVYCEWPSATTLLVPGIVDFVKGAKRLDDRRKRAHHCRDWVSRHIQRSVQHLHLMGDVIVELLADPERGVRGPRVVEQVHIFDAANQPGLTSMQIDKDNEGYLEGSDGYLLRLVSGWSAAVRAKVRNLEVCLYSPLEELIDSIALLPNLRRLKYEIGGLDSDDFAALARALESGGSIEALYLDIDSSEDLPIDCLEPFGAGEPRAACGSCRHPS